MNLFDVYPLFDIEIERGCGCHVYDKEGTEYLDLYGGHAVISVGHSHPDFVKALTEQAQKLVFYSNSIVNPLQKQLAEKLGAASGYDDYTLFLINSGAEANENALKLASFHTGKKKVVSFKKAFHGRTSAAVKITDIPSIVAPINDNIDVVFLAMNDIEAVKSELAGGDVCAVIIEGITGVGGIQIPNPVFLQQLREETTKAGAVLILDEIQSGYGRSGKFFAHQHAGIQPDIITVAKGIANGFPFAGVLISPMFEPRHGMLGTTFGGNHLGCAAAISVLDIMEKEQLVANAEKVGTYLLDQLRTMRIPGIREIRGKGLMIGIEFEESAKEIRNRLLFEQKVFTGAAGVNVIRLLPPLSLTLQQADEFLLRFKKAIGI